MLRGQCTKVKTSLGHAQHPHRRLESAAAHLGPSGTHKWCAATAAQLLPSLLVANRRLATHPPRQRARKACKRRATRCPAPRPRRHQGANSLTSRCRRTATASADAPPLPSRRSARAPRPPPATDLARASRAGSGVRHLISINYCCKRCGLPAVPPARKPPPRVWRRQQRGRCTTVRK